MVDGGHIPEGLRSVGPYKILCELGRGAMAVVYLARAEGPGGFERLLALKVLHPNLSEEPEFVDLFLNEARIAAKIQHPNVIAVYDIGTWEDRYYLRMDYVSGETMFQGLARTWNQGRPFPMVTAAQIVSETCKGLHAAHELRDSSGVLIGVIHRDVGPHNIMVGYDGIVRVMDFGIAKALDRVSGTKPGTWRGTLPFMAPEQIRAEGLDRRADIWSLGVVLWETTVGQRLFKHETVAGTMARVLGMDVPAPSSIVEDYPAALDGIVLKALERDPNRRYQTAEALARDLEAFAAARHAGPAPIEIRAFMQEIFADRLEKRQLMESLAGTRDVPDRITSLPLEDQPTQVMKLVEADDDSLLENPELTRLLHKELLTAEDEVTAQAKPYVHIDTIETSSEVTEIKTARRTDPDDTESSVARSLPPLSPPELPELTMPFSRIPTPLDAPATPAHDDWAAPTGISATLIRKSQDLPTPPGASAPATEPDHPAHPFAHRLIVEARPPPTEPVFPPSSPIALPSTSAPRRSSTPSGGIPRPSSGVAKTVGRKRKDVGFRIATGLVALMAIGGVMAIAMSGPKEAPISERERSEIVMVELSFVVTPPKADIRIDGEKHSGDLIVPLSPRQYTVIASADGYRPKTVIVSAEASRSIEIQLDKKKKKKRKRRRRRRGRKRRRR